MKRQIEIDFDVHKCIEMERRGFDESDNAVLRRLLGLPELSDASPVQPNEVLDALFNDSRPWRGKGVKLPEGTELLLEYQEVKARGIIHNGEWHIEGFEDSFRTPSRAAITIVTKERAEEDEISLNGWIYWQVKRPGDLEWKSLNSLRSKINKRRRRY